MQYNGIDLEKDDLRLYDVIDLDALDSLFCHQQDSNLFVEFDARDVTVNVRQAIGEIQVEVNDRRE